MLGLQSKALRTVFWWQGLATAAIAVIAAMVAGTHGGVSAVLGGLTTMAAGVAAGLLIQRSKAKAAADMLFAAMVAEAVRVGVMLAVLGLIFTTYKQVVPGGLIAAFIVTALIFSMAILVRENKQQTSLN